MILLNQRTTRAATGVVSLGRPFRLGSGPERHTRDAPRGYFILFMRYNTLFRVVLEGKIKKTLRVCTFDSSDTSGFPRTVSAGNPWSGARELIGKIRRELTLFAVLRQRGENERNV